MSWFGAPLGLLALLALPALIALHLFRRRHRDQPVTGLFLWLDAGLDAAAGPRRQPLRRDPVLWLECAAALLAALFLADFRPFGEATAQHFVLVLDDSASMSAAEPGAGGHDTRTRAIEEAEARISETGRRGRVTLVRSGRRPSLLAGPAALADEARAALAAWHPAATDHDLGPALAFARELAAGGRITLLTDAPLPAAARPADVEVVSVGRALENAGFVSAERVPVSAEEDEIRASVRGFAVAGLTRALTLRAAGQELHTQTLALASGATVHIALRIPRATPAVTL
jgi:hypothetical protein